MSGEERRYTGRTISATTGPRDVMRRLDALRTELERRGLRVSDTSRLPRYVQALQASLEKPRPLTDPADIDAFMTAVVEGQYLLDAYDGLVLAPEVPGWLPHFKRALKGLPEAVPHDPARDKMAELNIAAAARQGGFEVQLDEPDVRILFEGNPYCAAAKRIRTLDALDFRVREGVSQVERWKMPGFVLVDFSAALSLIEGFVYGPTTDEAPAALSVLRDKVADQFPDEAIERWLANKSFAVGVVGFAYVPYLAQADGHIVLLRCWVQRVREEANSEGARFLKELVSRIRLD